MLAALMRWGMAEGVDVQMLFCNVFYSRQAVLASTSNLLTSVKAVFADR